MAEWQRRFDHLAPRVMCVNVSAVEFGRPGFAAEVERILHETGLAPSKLKLEITESAFIADVGAAEATLSRLQALGVTWSIDDFGTGYSSLSYLHRLQAHTVKIDRSFVSRMQADAKGLEMIRVIVTMALNLGPSRKVWKRSSRCSNCRPSAANAHRATISHTPSTSMRPAVSSRRNPGVSRPARCVRAESPLPPR
jgi:predicted signal transduction protein with EAL and GGDEF domain